MIRRKEIRISEIEDNLAKIIDAVEIVENNLSSDFDSFSGSGLLKEGIYKKIEFAIESILDICNIINSDLRLGVPEAEENIIEHLERNKILDKKAIRLIKEMKKFRNVLVHKYGDVDDAKAYENIKNGLIDFEIIIKEIEIFLDKYKLKDKRVLKK